MTHTLTVKHMSRWRDDRGRFVRVTPSDVADAIREDRRVVFTATRAALDAARKQRKALRGKP
jgi:hypothetical protein